MFSVDLQLPSEAGSKVVRPMTRAMEAKVQKLVRACVDMMGDHTSHINKIQKSINISERQHSLPLAYIQ